VGSRGAYGKTGGKRAAFLGGRAEDSTGWVTWGVRGPERTDNVIEEAKSSGTDVF